MNVIFIARFVGAYSVHRAQMELIRLIAKQVDNFVLLGEFTPENRAILNEFGVEIIEKKNVKKVDRAVIKYLEEFADDFKPDIVHVINGKLLRSVNIAFKNHPAKIITYFGSVSLYWHDISSYFTYLSPRINKIICNSQFVYNHVKKQLFGKAKQRAVKIYKGYNSDWFSHIKAFDYSILNIPETAIVVALAASYSKNKRIEDFISSSYFLNTNKEVHYVVFGRDTTNDDLINLQKNSPINTKIHLLGLRTDAVELIKGADIYVQTSLKEGFGRAVSEAMCVGKPIVMTNCGGGTELIDKQSGIVVPKKNPQILAQAISKLVNDDKLRNKMGEAAKNRIDNVYHIDNTLQDVLALYKDVLA